AYGSKGYCRLVSRAYRNKVKDFRLSCRRTAKPGFDEAEALCGGKSDLRAGGFLGTFLPEKSTRTNYVNRLID
ncbi:MAG: hypothetical protein KAX50_11720, partial [Saprospiraceae bacterium]|nr:hypothetical protein [Saprospiraceae bacterium]